MAQWLRAGPPLFGNLPGVIALALIVTFLGIPLGTPSTDLRARLGDPLLVRPLGLSRVASYLRSDDPAAVLNVTERDGVVFAVEIERERPELARGISDPYNVALGMKKDAVLKLRGKPAIQTVNSWYYPENAEATASFIYRFDGEFVEAIKFIGSPASAPGDSTLPHIAEAHGDAYATAVLDLSRTPAESAHFVDRYLTLHDCSRTDRTSTVERRDGRTFAVTTASCGRNKRTTYFDTTAARQ
ncbi:MAG: hypothetical protein NVSMB5_07160 [Candidatus Velthaea sp.]